jgi:hypothetical protein
MNFNPASIFGKITSVLTAPSVVTKVTTGLAEKLGL